MNFFSICFSSSKLTPSGCPASLSREVSEAIWQTGRADVWVVLEINWNAQFQDGQVIVKCAGIILWMNVDRYNIAFNVWEEFNVMIDIPFAETNTQVISGISNVEERHLEYISSGLLASNHSRLNTMGCSENVSTIDQCTAANIN